MNNETPAEKAKRLGVPLRHTPPMIKEPEPNPFQQQQKTLNERYKEMFNSVSSVCETCNKELTRAQERPCGHSRCPFGILTMSY